MAATDHYVIIGNGPTGNSAAEVLREYDNSARITIISDESFSYYYRHKLLGLISEELNEQNLVVKHYSFYKEKNIHLRMGQRVERIEPVSKTLTLKHKEKINYSKLIIATGGCPRILPSLSRFREHIILFSKYEDVLKCKAIIKKSKKIAVLGGDLISFCSLKMLNNINKEIEFFLYGDAFWPFELTDRMVDKISSSFENKGIVCHSKNEIKSITKKGNSYILQTKKKKDISCDLVIGFMGLIPNINFLIGSDIDTDRGILVDDHLRTNYKDIYAAGDCAQIYNPELKNYWVSIGWENALAQGKIAALNLLGDHNIIKPVKEKILKFEGVKVNTSWWKKF